LAGASPRKPRALLLASRVDGAPSAAEGLAAALGLLAKGVETASNTPMFHHDPLIFR
jgi:hypothetical protein